MTSWLARMAETEVDDQLSGNLSPALAPQLQQGQEGAKRMANPSTP